MESKFLGATSAANKLGQTRADVLRLAGQGKLTAWVEPRIRHNIHGEKLPIVVLMGKPQPTSDGPGKKVQMPDGQYLRFEPDALVELKGSGWLDLSLLTTLNHELIQAAMLLQDGQAMTLSPGVVVGDGEGHFYAISPKGPPVLAEVGFMADDLRQTDTTPVENAEKHKPLNAQSAQEATILDCIKQLGHDPLNLPKNPKGKPGVKAAVKLALRNDRLFTGTTVFEKAWERLAAQKEIVIVGQVSP